VKSTVEKLGGVGRNIPREPDVVTGAASDPRVVRAFAQLAYAPRDFFPGRGDYAARG
jgi:hypothetical protein